MHYFCRQNLCRRLVKAKSLLKKSLFCFEDSSVVQGQGKVIEKNGRHSIYIAFISLN